MSTTPSPFAQTWYGLKCLAEVHEWESQHLPFLRTASGRDLYFQIVDKLLAQEQPDRLQLKAFSLHLTDRIMRTRIQEFVGLGLLTVSADELDQRRKSLTPTPKLMAIFHEHTLQLRQAVLKRFNYSRRP